MTYFFDKRDQHLKLNVTNIIGDNNFDYIVHIFQAAHWNVDIITVVGLNKRFIWRYIPKFHIYLWESDQSCKSYYNVILANRMF